MEELDFEEEQEVKPKRLSRKQIERVAAIETIQAVAREAIGVNFISKELTYQQAFSILLRSRQLEQASQREYDTNQKYVAEEMDWCWGGKKR